MGWEELLQEGKGMGRGLASANVQRTFISARWGTLDFQKMLQVGLAEQKNEKNTQKQKELS